MAAVRSFADLGAVCAPPSVVPVIADGIEIGHIIAHGEAQASAYSAAGRPLGVFHNRSDAESAVKAAMGGSAFGD
jgi:hypothetical protein